MPCRSVRSSARCTRTAAIAAALVVLAFTADAAAQRHGGGRDRFIEFSHGERGHSESAEGRTNGEVDAAREANPSEGYCVGWVPLRPNHQVLLTDDFRFLEMWVESPADTTLVVHGPGGTRCNDDSDGLDPALGGQWQAGLYNIYIGTFDNTAPANYTFSIRQGRRRGGPPGWGEEGTVETTLDVTSTTATYASLAVSARLGREGLGLDGRAGGPVAMSYLGNSAAGPCVGYAASTPNHIFTLDRAIPALVTSVDSMGDTTLVIHGPNGWMCNDDTDGTNPAVTGDWPAGRYLVWVGTYAAGAGHDYRLSVAVGGRGPGGRRQTPTSWSFRGAFEGVDMYFNGASVDAVHGSCMSYFQGSGGASLIDDVVVWGAAHRNSASYWDEAELCGMVALNARPDDGSTPITLTGAVEQLPFSVQGDTDEIRRVVLTYLPQMAAAGWIDDITIAGTNHHNGPSYWEPAVAATIVAYNIEPVDAWVVARGTIEEVPFIFSGDSPEDVRLECGRFLSSGAAPNLIDDVVVNGNTRRNAASYWDNNAVCMLVSSLAE